MRTRFLFCLVLLGALLGAALGAPAPAQADPPYCLWVDQQCVSCGRGCGKLCNFYECDDGTSYSTCGGCNCIEGCPAF
jgi:hypothetical protein